MTNKAPDRPAPESGGLNLGEIYYVLFRRKWLILTFSVAGLAAAALLYLQSANSYMSEAKLLVRFVMERQEVDPISAGEQVRSPDARGESIINSELEILSSLDLARQVAQTITPAKILPKNSRNPGVAAAAAYINRNLKLANANRSSVIQISFEHPDPEIARSVLQQLIEAYKTKHMETHRGAGPLQTYLSQQRDKYRAELSRTDEELRKLKNKVGVVSVEESRKTFIDQASRIRQELLSADTELAERSAIFKQMENSGTSKPPTTNAVVRPEVSAAVVEEYRALMFRLDAFRKREQEWLTQFTEKNLYVIKNRQLIEEADQQRAKLEEANPGLKYLQVQTTTEKTGKIVDLAGESSRLVALQAKIAVLQDQQAQTRTNLVAIEEVEPDIERLQAKRSLDEANLRVYQTGLDRSMTEAGGGSGGMPNIVSVQEASVASPVTSRALKQVGIALFAGIGGGLGLAFLIELILRQSIRHSSQVEKKLGLPLFISIPKFGRNGSSRSRNARRTESLRRNGARVAGASASDAEPAQIPGDLVGTRSPGGADLAVAEWDGSHQLRSYCEALRDRLITFFEVGNMTHKPKLVAVTGCSKGAGVSSVAAGLAATLSETGEGNVLLVDMNLEHGAAHPYFHGKPAIGITNAFDAKDRQLAHVQENLYAVSASVMNEALPRALPKRFASLVPRFKASDYDYIIFDMPQITQTSLTPRLASYMDMVLLVLEAEKTNLGIAGRAVELLRESRANVAAVLNRKRKYVPAWLLEEF